jgi:hypothetical protein
MGLNGMSFPPFSDYKTPSRSHYHCQDLSPTRFPRAFVVPAPTNLVRTAQVCWREGRMERGGSRIISKLNLNVSIILRFPLFLLKARSLMKQIPSTSLTCAFDDACLSNYTVGQTYKSTNRIRISSRTRKSCPCTTNSKEVLCG